MAGLDENSHIANSNSKFSENTTQVSQNNAFESSNFLHDINVDSFTGCHSRLYIYMFIPQLNKLVPMKIDTGSDIYLPWSLI